MTNQDIIDEEKKNREEALRNTEIIMNVNALAQNDALENVENQEQEVKNQEIEETTATTAEALEPTQTEESESNSVSQAEETQQVEEEIEEEPQPEEIEEIQPEDEIFQEIEQENSSETNFDELLSQKFVETVKQDREKLESSLEAIKKSHPKDYDAYVEKLKNTKYYKKSLEKWTNYYADIKNKCAEEVNNDIEALAKETAILDEGAAMSSNNQSAHQQIAQPANQGGEVSQAEDEIVPVQEVQIAPAQEEVAPVDNQVSVVEPTVEELEVKKYVPLASNGKMLVDANLRKTVEEVLLDCFYASFDEASDFYNKMNAETNENKKDNKIVEFRNELATYLQQVHNKVFPNESKIYTPYVESMQKDIQNRSGNMNTNSVAEQIFDQFYHIDTKTKQTSGTIPALAEKLSAKIQDILLANDVLEFNLSKDNVERILNRIVNDYEVGEKLQQANEISTGIVQFVNMLTEDINQIRSENVTYDETLLGLQKNLINQLKLDNSHSCSCDNYSYSKLEKIVEDLDKCTKMLVDSKQTVKTNTEARTILKQSLLDLNVIKSNAKASDSLNAKSDKRLVKDTNKIKIVSDYLTANLIKKATNDLQSNNLSSFNYTNDEALMDLSNVYFLFDAEEKTKALTSDTLDSINLMIQEFIVKHEKNYLSNKEKIDAYLDEVTRFTGVLEEDEKLQNQGNYTEKDAQKIIDDQKYAKVLIADFTHLQKMQNKKNLTNKEVENLDLGLVK